ncbi:hypothetical protein [Mumia zhuanghuii]|uniref:hypothetical protein n=1 Tax=Mumia zhuanghuii TaxID=2585211 RepID=UPI00129C91A3|nr:hypothetical protein [Mumia zhuanghuii]
MCPRQVRDALWLEPARQAWDDDGEMGARHMMGLKEWGPLSRLPELRPELR